MSLSQINKHKIILASESPRRKILLKKMGIKFRTIASDYDENFPYGMPAAEAVLFISRKKADTFLTENIAENEIIITADTLVSVNGEIMPKPNNFDEAFEILKKLSANMHNVYTGITLKNKYKTHSFLTVTSVWFRELTDEEISYYVSNYNPFDKAGAYGIQEWLGYVGIKRIEGSFYNVVGLPTCTLYAELLKFI